MKNNVAYQSMQVASDRPSSKFSTDECKFVAFQPKLKTFITGYNTMLIWGK
ncbi:hypothetical protein Fmac_000264 [Flemingia macrophylla]|uniref:Uncharacterized protein n=1 Tax=Flemingia macrophylla TaxID=520843 RepID=A0ABD1NDS8_9FABA